MPFLSDVRYATMVYDVGTMAFVPWDGSISVGSQAASTATVTSVADTASSATLLSANTDRLGGSIFNDSTAILYVRYGTSAASTTSYTVQVPPNWMHPILANYTGQINGIWATDPGTGAARITELT